MSFLPHHVLVGAEPGPDTRVAVVLHGILGSARNWRGFIRGLSENNPGWTFILVDHRFHGDSGAAPSPHTLRGCAADLGRLLRSLEQSPDMVIGHSFGGKVALAYARELAPPSLRQVVVLDALPSRSERPQTVQNNFVLQVIEAIRETRVPAEDRREVKAELLAQGIPRPVVEWLATSLRRGEAGWAWCFDIEAVSAMIQNYFEIDFWPYLRALGETPRVTVIRAERSDRWTDRELEPFANSRAQLLQLEGAGHWLHVDNPKGLALQLAGLLDAC
jgi:esterase